MNEVVWVKNRLKYWVRNIYIESSGWIDRYMVCNKGILKNSCLIYNNFLEIRLMIC